ncbi:hypothetical protein MAR_029506 [Mya arenaria]|uniref:Uncharacterized protein n=1 Tax=Mya arenaria TaxID=6604 RepID=A0ABY7DJM9_MYAAR|nr:hypothetical protein MAR_029506 [Mya arenaria]
MFATSKLQGMFTYEQERKENTAEKISEIERIKKKAQYISWYVISTSRSRKVVKKLEMSNAILAEVRDAVQKTKSQSERGVIMRVISGKILKKYKCLDTVRKQTGLGRKGMTMRSAKLEILPNPETVGKTINMDGIMDILSKLDHSEKVTFEKWQRVNDDDDGKKRMKIVKVEMEKVEFQFKTTNLKTKHLMVRSMSLQLERLFWPNMTEKFTWEKS